MQSSRVWYSFSNNNILIMQLQSVILENFAQSRKDDLLNYMRTLKQQWKSMAKKMAFQCNYVLWNESEVDDDDIDEQFDLPTTTVAYRHMDNYEEGPDCLEPGHENFAPIPVLLSNMYKWEWQVINGRNLFQICEWRIDQEGVLRTSAGREINIRGWFWADDEDEMVPMKVSDFPSMEVFYLLIQYREIMFTQCDESLLDIDRFLRVYLDALEDSNVVRPDVANHQRNKIRAKVHKWTKIIIRLAHHIVRMAFYFWTRPRNPGLPVWNARLKIWMWPEAPAINVRYCKHDMLGSPGFVFQ